jgi:hypothetical protein
VVQGHFTGNGDARPVRADVETARRQRQLGSEFLQP